VDGEDLLRAWHLARAAWPGVEVSAHDFGAYLAEKSAADPGAGAVHATDLYLALACARGDPAALASFERSFFPEVDAAVRRVRGDAPPASELRQVLRHHFFVASPGERPKVCEYTGRGALKIWVRIAAVRTALNLAVREAREVAFENDAMAFLVGSGEDPELAYLKRLYTHAFKEAFADAFLTLAPRERSLLRYAFGEGLTVDAIGAIYGVHRATAARWVSRALEHLVTAMKKALAGRVGVKDVASILRLIESQMGLTLGAYLKRTTG
jgi:RNA polymerase sigma-70 factor (ECF subfamily)